MYLGKKGMRQEDKMKVEESFFHLRTKFCYGKYIEWRGMSNIIEQRCE